MSNGRANVLPWNCLVPGEFEVLVLECPGLREFRKDTFGRALRHGEAVGKVDIRRRAAADRRQQLGDVRLRTGTIVIFTQISGFAWLKLSTILAIVSEAGGVCSVQNLTSVAPA